MRAYDSGSESIDDTGTEIDLALKAPDGIRYCVLRWRVRSGSRVAFSAPGLGVGEDECAESASASGETATSGAMQITGGNPTLICATGETATVAWTLYALTDELP